MVLTNAEKFLKDGVGGVQDFTEALMEFNEERKFVTDWYAKAHSKDFIDLFLNEATKPTLTEDERVILRNIDQCEYQKIARKTGALFLIGDNVYGKRDTSYMFGTLFKSNLFQFIKERRRI